MLTSETKRRIDACRDILVGKFPLPTDQVELITLALIHKFMGLRRTCSPVHLFLLVVFSFASSMAFAVDGPAQWGHWPNWGDQGDGTYRNPVLPCDYSDLDCIRVGDDYYAISSTMQFSPGMAILHSKDLVNWALIGHAVNDLTQIGPELHWDRMNRYGRGIWAGAIRYAKGRFWIYFGTPDEGYFMTSAVNPAGPWEPLHPLMKSSGWDDCCPFWDDDGQGYFVGTHFKDRYKTYLWKLTPDGKGLIEDSRVLINEGAGREASKLLKVNGTYYHFFSEVLNGTRVVMMQRSKTIMGPYTERRQLTAANRESNEPNQGGLVDTVNGEWYFLTHHGKGDWEGRAASLLPVTWNEGWPIPGATDSTGKPGLMVWSGKKPLPGRRTLPQTSDDFTSASLGSQWQWNYQPRADHWSLSERPGFLRLKAFRPLKPDDMMTAGNTLTQRSFRSTENQVTLCLDLSGMADGQKAGLCHFAKSHSALGIARDGDTLRIESRENGKLAQGPEIRTGHVWLRSSWGLDGRSRYAYSTDGKEFVDFGPEYKLSWGYYRGDRIGIYCFNTKQDQGHVDVDFLEYFTNPGH